MGFNPFKEGTSYQALGKVNKFWLKPI